MPEWYENIGVCYDPMGNQTNCTATELGEQFYNAYNWATQNQGLDESGSFQSFEPLTDFWSNVVFGYQDPDTTGWEPGAEGYYDWQYQNVFMPNYGASIFGMMPGEDILGNWNSLIRAERMGDIRTESLRDQYARDISTQEFNIGSTGLSRVGAGSVNQLDLYSQFLLDAEAEQIETEQAQSDIYGDFGEQISEDLDWLFDPEGGLGIDPDDWETPFDEVDWYMPSWGSEGATLGSTMIPIDPNLMGSFDDWLQTQWEDEGLMDLDISDYDAVSNTWCAQFMFEQGYGANPVDAMQYCQQYEDE
jgi:hypothetical protein